MWRSTAIAPRWPRVAPAEAASSVSGRTPTTTSTMSTLRTTSWPSVVVASTRSRPGSPGAARAIGADRRPGEHVHAVVGELSVDEGADLGVDGGEHLGELLHLGHRQPTGHEGLGHLQPDVAGADDDGAGRGALLEGAHDGEGVPHGMQEMDPVVDSQGVGAGEPIDGRADRHGPGADDQLVVGKKLLVAVPRR